MNRKNEKLLGGEAPPRELDAMGSTESLMGRNSGLGYRLREKLREKDEEEKKELKVRKKAGDFNSFLERQQKMEQKRKTRTLQKKQKETRELGECSWSPVINKQSKRLNRTYQDLSQWNQRKKKQLETKRKEKKKESEENILDFKASKNSENILKKAEQRFAS